MELYKLYFTIKKFKKGLKQLNTTHETLENFTIKKFKKGLKPIFACNSFSFDFTIKKFKKGLKLLIGRGYSL